MQVDLLNNHVITSLQELFNDTFICVAFWTIILLHYAEILMLRYFCQILNLKLYFILVDLLNFVCSAPIIRL